MLKSQVPNTCNTLLTDTGNNVNVTVLLKDFYHRPLDMVQVVIVRHKPFRFLGIALSCNSSQAFMFQDDKDVFVLDVSLRKSLRKGQKREEKKEKVMEKA